MISEFMDLYRILLIEDDPPIGQSLVDGFRTHGFEPQLCNTGASGLEFTVKNSPHVTDTVLSLLTCFRSIC